MVWHCRALLAHAGGPNWAILTPDHDVYIEELSASNTDFTGGFFYCGENGAIPAHVDPNTVYGFDPLTPQDLGAFRMQGQILADAHRLAAGLPLGPPVLPPAAPAAVAPMARPPQVWDVVARDPAALPAGSHSIGERGIVPAGIGSILVKKVKPSEAAAYRMDDLRVLPIKFDAQGVRRQDFPTAVSSMDDAEPSGGGIQLTGPPTALKLLKDMRDQAFTPSTFHGHLFRTAEIPKGDRSVFERERLSRILESLVVVDQLNAPSLQSAELICRRLQVIREAHRISPGQPDYSAADTMMGWKYRRSGQGIDSALAAHVANELKAEAAIAKEARKAREEQAARRKGRNPKKGATEGGVEG